VTARRLLTILLASLTVWLWLAAPGASAHAELLGSTPANGATVAAAPARVTLTFSEAVVVRECAVTADGHHLTLTQPPGEPAVVVADLTPLGRVTGRLTLSWRSVSSDDGHVATGTLGFIVGAAPGAAGGTATAALPQPDPVVKDLLTATQGVEFAGLILFVGGLAFLSVIWPDGAYERRTRRVLVGAWLAGLAAAVAMPGLQDAYDELLPLGRVASTRISAPCSRPARCSGCWPPPYSRRSCNAAPTRHAPPAGESARSRSRSACCAPSARQGTTTRSTRCSARLSTRCTSPGCRSGSAA
jgi:methionine-rich copper-binding protein CopC